MTGSKHSVHYDNNYFDWQGETAGRFGGRVNQFKFKDTIRENDIVIDFGCGGGYLLASLKCKEKLGIEVNHSAHDKIVENGVTPYSSINDLLHDKGKKFADVIISDNALEHTLHPLLEIETLRPLLKDTGKIHFIVPCDSISFQWRPNDINNHLYSFSPMNLGNLFTEAGFDVLHVKPYIHKWPPFYKTLYKIFGWRTFNFLCLIWGRIDRRWFQVEIIATPCK